MALLTREETLALGARMEHESAGMDDDALLPYLLDVWDKLPEPKQDNPEQIANWIIDIICDIYQKDGRFAEVKIWALRGLENDTAQMDGSYEYAQAGLVCYELGEYDEAYRYFDEAYRRGAYRGAFQEYDKKYWQFYKMRKAETTR